MGAVWTLALIPMPDSPAVPNSPRSIASRALVAGSASLGLLAGLIIALVFLLTSVFGDSGIEGAAEALSEAQSEPMLDPVVERATLVASVDEEMRYESSGDGQPDTYHPTTVSRQFEYDGLIQAAATAYTERGLDHGWSLVDATCSEGASEVRITFTRAAREELVVVLTPTDATSSGDGVTVDAELSVTGRDHPMGTAVLRERPPVEAGVVRSSDLGCLDATDENG